MANLTIGKAAKATGVRIATVRFYERRGLIAPPPKPESGYPRKVTATTTTATRGGSRRPRAWR